MSLIIFPPPPEFSPVTGNGVGTFSAYSGFAADTEDAYGVGTFSAYSSTGESYGEGTGAGTFRAYSGNAYGSPGDGTQYSIANGTWSSYSSYAEAGLAEPQWAVGDGLFLDYAGWGTGVNGAAGVGVGVFSAYSGFADNTGNAFGAGTFSAYSGVAYSADTLATTIFVGAHRGRYLFAGRAEPIPVDRSIIVAHGGGYPFSAQTGVQAVGELPTGTFTGTAVGTGIATAVGKLPVGYLTAVAIGTGTAAVIARTRGRYVLVAHTGAQSTGDLPIGTLTATALTGGVGVFVGTGPVGVLTAVAVALNWVRAEGTLPALRALNGAQLVAVGPRTTLYAIADLVVTLAYEGYSITIVPSPEGVATATTRLTTCPFEHIVRFGNAYYGVAADGLFELAGDLYDNAPIVAVVDLAPSNMGTQALKRARSLRVSGRIGGDLAASVTAGEAFTESSIYRPAQIVGDRNWRIKLGKGKKGAYLGYSLTNTNGEDFQIDALTPDVDVLQRRLGGSIR